MSIGDDKVQLIKQESTALGGKDADKGPFDSPEPINAQEDAIEAAGIYLNDEIDRDDNVAIYRDLGNMYFKDVPNSSGISLSQFKKKQAQTVTVAVSGGDFTSIQSAIDSITDASSIKPYVVLVYPGVYSENLTLKNYVDIKGAGARSDAIISVTSGTAFTFPSTVSTVQNVTVLVNTTANATKVLSVASGGAHYLIETLIIFNAIGAACTVFDVSVGLIRVADIVVSYTHSGADGGADHVIADIGANGGVTARDTYLTAVVAADEDVYGLKIAATSVIEAVTNTVQLGLTVTADDYSGNVYGVYHSGSADKLHFLSSHVSLQATGGGTITGEARHVTVTGGSGRLIGTGNAIHVEGFAKNYFADIGSGCTFVSHFDDATASDGKTGVGDFYAVWSTENGTLRVTEALDVGDVLSGNYLDVNSDGQITLHGTARAEKHIHFPVRLFGGGTTDVGTIIDTAALFFDATTDEYRSFSFDIPDDIDLTVDPKLRLYIAPRSNRTVGSDFVFRITDLRYINIAEALDKTPDETDLDATVTVSDTRRTVTYADITLDGSLMGSGEGLSGRLYRLATDSGDDRNGDACIVGMTFIYTTDKVN